MYLFYYPFSDEKVENGSQENKELYVMYLYILLTLAAVGVPYYPYIAGLTKQIVEQMKMIRAVNKELPTEIVKETRRWQRVKDFLSQYFIYNQEDINGLDDLLVVRLIKTYVYYEMLLSLGIKI